jgi:hypothetical protein
MDEAYDWYLSRKVAPVLLKMFAQVRDLAQTPSVSDAISSIERDVGKAIYDVPDDPLGRALQCRDWSEFGAGGGAFADTLTFFLVLPNTPTHKVLARLSEIYRCDYVGLICDIRNRGDIQTRCKLGLKWLGHILICGEVQLGRSEVYIAVVPVGQSAEGRSAILPEGLLTPEQRKTWLRQDPTAKFINGFMMPFGVATGTAEGGDSGSSGGSA